MFIVEIKFHIWNVIPYQNTQCDIYLIILRLPILCFYEFELMANYITRGKKILSRHPSWKTLYKMEGYTRCPFRAGRFYIITTDTHTYSLCLFSRISSIFHSHLHLFFILWCSLQQGRRSDRLKAFFNYRFMYFLQQISFKMYVVPTIPIHINSINSEKHFQVI